jgi:hypothetical protein
VDFHVSRAAASFVSSVGRSRRKTVAPLRSCGAWSGSRRSPMWHPANPSAPDREGRRPHDRPPDLASARSASQGAAAGPGTPPAHRLRQGASVNRGG